MQLNSNLLKSCAIVFAFGVVLLLLTYVGALILPLIGVESVVYLGYFLYKAAKEQGMF